MAGQGLIAQKEDPSKGVTPMDISQFGTSQISNFNEIIDKDSSTGNS
jgi:hypothetical protein